MKLRADEGVVCRWGLIRVARSAPHRMILAAEGKMVY